MQLLDAGVPVSDGYLYQRDPRGATWLRLSHNTKPGLWVAKYCPTCHIWRPPRSHHCGECGVCMVRLRFICLLQSRQDCVFGPVNLSLLCATRTPIRGGVLASVGNRLSATPVHPVWAESSLHCLREFCCRRPFNNVLGPFSINCGFG